MRYLETLGHTVVLAENANEVFGGYLAGTDDQRVADINAMFADPRIDAIFCSRGGYGSGRLLDKVNYSLIRKNPKIFVGFSDITALQLAIFKRTGLVTFSGPLPSVDMAEVMKPETEEMFWAMLSGANRLTMVQQPWPMEVVQQGSAEGTLLAGNLSVLCSLLGTRFLPSFRGSILLVEDIAEDTYRIDRMFNQLHLAGVFRRCAAFVTGDFTQHESVRSTPHRDVADVIAEYAPNISGPVISKVMYGHTAHKLTIPVGIRAAVGSNEPLLQFLEPAVQM